MVAVIYFHMTHVYYYCYFVVGSLQNKKKLDNYVIASGLMYGEGENVLRYVFNVRG